MKKILQQPFFIKLFNWEYWPFNMVYGPVYIYWLWLCIKAKAVFFFNTSNPSIKNGGFLMESKKQIYDLIPPVYYPATLLFSPGTHSMNVIKQVAEKGINFPLIAKPDIGMRGIGVQKITNLAELNEYASESKVDYLVQAFVPFENEVGIFYYRYPHEQQGHISGIVGKEFLTVTGDGIVTIEQLLLQDPRYILQLSTLKQSHPGVLKMVLEKNEQYLLVPYGNHCRGAKFLDLTHLADSKLTEMINEMCMQVPGFYFGRLDVRYKDWEALKQGKDFSVIELNGAGSEPTHMYDPSHSILYAWKEIIRHWNILFAISRQNHQLLKMPYMKFKPGMQMLKENAAYVKLISSQFYKQNIIS